MKFLPDSCSTYPWTISGCFRFRGFFLHDGTLYRGEKAIAFLRSQLAEFPVETVLYGLNGSFSIVWQQEEFILFAVDRVRSMPLYYAIVDGELWLSSDGSAIVDALPTRTLNSLSEREFLRTYSVSGNDTLLKELHQVNMAEFCVFHSSSGQISTNCYYRIRNEIQFDEEDLPAMTAAFEQTQWNVARDLVLALEGRTAVVPLSGGADSRQILKMLRMMNYPKVLCFSYGRKDSAEVQMAQGVAEYFGYPWEQVVYTPQLWKSLRNDPIMKGYCRRAFAYCSLPHLQDFAALYALMCSNRLPEDGVILPGHGGDLQAGTWLCEDMFRGNWVSDTFYSLLTGTFTNGARLVDREWREKAARLYPIDTPEHMAASAETCAKEQHAKFITNSARLFEEMGHEWLMPLWSSTWGDFWHSVPLSWRYQRRLCLGTSGTDLTSTNDPSAYKSFAAMIRRTPFLCGLGRRYTRCKDWWCGKLAVEQLLPASSYFQMALLHARNSNEIAAYTIIKTIRPKLSGQF